MATDTLTAGNVVVAGTGAVWRAPLATTLPTDADAYLPIAWKGHGYINPDGVAEALNTQNQDIYSWQNSALVRKLVTQHNVEYTFAGQESNEVMLETYYGNHTAGKTEIRGGQGIRAAWVFDFLDGDDFHVRLCVPDGQVTAWGGVTRNAQGAMEYPVTVTCYPDSSDVKVYMYVDSTPISSS